MQDADAAFTAGDYLSAACHLSSDSWQYWASLGLLGHPADAAEALTRFTEPSAAFFSGVASWIAGDDDRAQYVLARCEGAHARRLEDLIAKRPITVLAQLPWNRRGAWDILTHLKDPAFRVLNVSFHPEDIPNEPYADATAFVPAGVRPDFFVAAMLEWHLIPPNIRMLGCPVIGHSSDFDLHVQAVVPWLPLFDELVVLDHVQWRMMSGAVSVPVSVFPKVFGVPAQLPRLGMHDRHIDVFLSGTIGHPYHHDKDPVVLDILRISDVQLRMVQGFESETDYYENLAASKVCCTFVRHSGAMPTRGLEGLGMGCATVVQEDSALRLFMGQAEGVLPYRASNGSLTTVIQSVLSGWDDYSLRARRGAAIVRQEFALDRVASQYFRFLTFLAARPRVSRSGPDPARLLQKRPVLHNGWLPSNRFSRGLLMDWAAASAARLEDQIGSDETAALLNDLARERLLAHFHDHTNAAEWLDAVVAPLERAIERFPTALVPRFNLVRILLHFGEPQRVRRGISLIDETLGRTDAWQLDPLDDVLPWDFCPSWFNYRRYFDTVARALNAPGEFESQLVALILASLNHYRARYADEIASDRSKWALAAEAVRLDPSFAEYVLYYCRLLITQGNPADLCHASTQLQQIVTRSARLLEIVDIARHLPAELRGEWFEDLQILALRLWSATKLRENSSEPVLRGALTAGVRPTLGHGSTIMK
jgi:hypothetical protein